MRIKEGLTTIEEEIHMIEEGISYNDEKSKKSTKKSQHKSIEFPPIKEEVPKKEKKPKKSKKEKKEKFRKNDNLDNLANVILNMIDLAKDGKEVDIE